MIKRGAKDDVKMVNAGSKSNRIRPQDKKELKAYQERQLLEHRGELDAKRLARRGRRGCTGGCRRDRQCGGAALRPDGSVRVEHETQQVGFVWDQWRKKVVAVRRAEMGRGQSILLYGYKT
jgi:hypothetical protein